MKKVLLVSLAFPPLPVVGIFRVAKFCKYLPEHGWQPYVITERIRKTGLPGDWASLEEIRDFTRITRTINFQPFLWWDNRLAGKTLAAGQTGRPTGEKTPEPARTERPPDRHYRAKKLGKIQLLRKILSVPDARNAWIPQALLPGLMLIAREKIDAIFSSSPPPTNHLLGYLLSLLTDRPHIIDYRDLWTLNESYHLRNFPPFLEKFDARLEMKVLKHCRRIICTTNTFKNKMLANFPFIGRDKIDVIYNGADQSDFAEFNPPDQKNKQFTIAYFGGLYGYRDPVPFFKGLSRWLAAEPQVKDRVRVDFWGSDIRQYNTSIDSLDLTGNVFSHPRIPQNEVIARMFQTDLLLLIQGLDKRSGESIPTKLFEYMIIGLPILAFIVGGEAADLINRQSENRVISSDDTEAIAGYLQNQYTIWAGRDNTQRKQLSIPVEFTRHDQARRLAEILDNITA